MALEFEANEVERLSEESKESVGKARGLVDGMKSVQEYENVVLEDQEPPLFVPADSGTS